MNIQQKMHSNSGVFSFISILFVCVIVAFIFFSGVGKKTNNADVENDADLYDATSRPIVDPEQQMSVLEDAKMRLKAIDEKNKQQGDYLLDQMRQ
jgi:hypothetical protein